MSSCDLFIFAGETSGDLHGEQLLESLYKKNPQLKISGVGGPKMRSRGMQCVLPMEAFQVMGFIDILPALPRLIRQFYAVRKAILEAKPKAVVLIDYAEFNLRMSASLRKAGYRGKLIHYISPSVWAWRKNRTQTMAKNLDLLLSILPFEAKHFASTPLKVSYVGHPLTSRLQEHHYRPALFSHEKRLVSLFPGSRKKEIERNFPLYLRLAKRLLARHPDLHFGISTSHERFVPLLKELMQQAGLEDDPRYTLIPETQTYDLMRASHLAVAKSGTVTLELALHRVPTVVTYAISSLDLIIARDLLRIRLPYYCIVNIIGEKEIFSEFIGPNCREERIFTALENLITNPAARKKSVQECDRISELLENKKTGDEAALCILNEI